MLVDHARLETKAPGFPHFPTLIKPSRIFYSFPALFRCHRTEAENALTSLGASLWTNSSKILLALEASLVFERVFLKSSHASQKSRFSSLNSVFRKVWKAVTPPGEGREKQLTGQKRGEEEEDGCQARRCLQASPWELRP